QHDSTASSRWGASTSRRNRPAERSLCTTCEAYQEVHEAPTHPPPAPGGLSASALVGCGGVPGTPWYGASRLRREFGVAAAWMPRGQKHDPVLSVAMHRGTQRCAVSSP